MLRELPDDNHRLMVAGHAAVSLAFISYLLHSPNNELASARKANVDLAGKNEELLAEVAHLKAAAATAEKTHAVLVVEVLSSKQANIKLEKELSLMAQKLEEVKGDGNDFEKKWNSAVK